MTKLNQRQQRFVEEMLIDDNATQAYIRAGYAPDAADVSSHRLANLPYIKEALAKARAERSARLKIDADAVLERLWLIATADPNELSQNRRCACRYCHGDSHRYQWRDHTEFEEAVARARDKGRPEPDDSGGFGFTATSTPHPDCPRCDGLGQPSTFIADTRHLSKAARMLYAGMKETRDGVEVKTHDQFAALMATAKHLGMFTEKVEHSGKLSVDKLSDADLEAQIAAYERAGGTDAAGA